MSSDTLILGFFPISGSTMPTPKISKRPSKNVLEQIELTIAKSTRENGDTWTLQEDMLLIRAKEHDRLGWAQIAALFPRRSSNSCQQRYSRSLAKSKVSLVRFFPLRNDLIFLRMILQSHGLTLIQPAPQLLA